MTRQEFIDGLKYVKSLVELENQYQNMLRRYQRYPVATYTPIILKAILPFLISLAILWWLGRHPVLFVPAILIVSSPTLVRIRTYRKTKRIEAIEIPKLKQWLDEHEDENQIVQNKLHQQNIVPAKYLNVYSIQKFITYVHDMRANNMKDAVNLLEEELRHKEFMESQQRLNEQLYNLNNSIGSMDKEVAAGLSTLNQNVDQLMRERRHY